MNRVGGVHRLHSFLHTARNLPTFCFPRGKNGITTSVQLAKASVLLENSPLRSANKLRAGVVRLPSLPAYSLCTGGYLDAPPKAPIVPISKELAEGSLCEGSKGTTTLAFIFKRGVIVAAEHQRFLSSGSVPNVVTLNSHMVASISGGSEFLLKDLQEKCLKDECAKGRRTSVAEASKWLADTLSSRSEEGLSVEVLIAGWEEMGPVLYHVDSMGKIQDCKKIQDYYGKVHKCAVVATGSAAANARSFLGCTTYYNMPVAEAVFLGKDAICAASRSSSIKGGDVGAKNGDVVSVYHIGKTGWKKHFSAHDIVDYQKRYLPVHREYKWNRPDDEVSDRRKKIRVHRDYLWKDSEGKVHKGLVGWD